MISSIINKFPIEIIGYILLAPIAFLWIWGILFVARDISHRTENILYEVFSILLAFIGGPIGLLIYLLIRPYYTLYEKKLLDYISTNGIECLNCNTINPNNHNFCSNCGDFLKIECKECKKQYYKGYDYCPYCGAPNIENN